MSSSVTPLFNRDIQQELLIAASSYPVVTILGPRQSGKTTLVRQLFPQKPYVSLENPDDRSLAEQDPRAFFDVYPKGAILDEIQRLPMLLSYIQGIVDFQQKKGICWRCFLRVSRFLTRHPNLLTLWVRKQSHTKP